MWTNTSLWELAGSWSPLERGTLAYQSKTSNRFVSVKSTSSQTLPGKASPVRLTADTHFVVRLYSGDIDPTTLVHLKPFAPKKNDRELLVGSGGAGMFRSAGSKTAEDNSILISVKKYGSKSVEIVPSQPLAPGEYCFMSAMKVNCFGVDAK